jgi:Holliday junction resolvase
MKKSMRFLTSPINVLMIILVAGMFVGSIPAYAGSAASSSIMQYEKGLISEAELDQRLRDAGYSEADLRQVKAVSGGLEHQQDDYVPLSESVAKNMEEKSDVNKASKVSAEEADNIMLILGIGGAVMVVAIAIAFSKKALAS